MLQSILEDGMRWHASLLHSLVEHNERPGLAHARRMSDLEHTAWRRQQRGACLVVKQALSRGRRLSMERDSKKRSYDEMSPTEQQLLEDFDVHRLQKQVDKTSMRVEKKAFRGSVLSLQRATRGAPPQSKSSTATEHAHHRSASQQSMLHVSEP